MGLGLGINTVKQSNMKTKLFFLLLAVLGFVSCKTVKSGTSKTKDIEGIGVIHKPVVVDLEINQQKITKTIQLKYVESMELAKNEAIREILKENKADLFIEPKYETVTVNGKTELTITGWLGYYKNFKTIEEKDLKLLEVKPAYLNSPNTTQPIIITKK